VKLSETILEKCVGTYLPSDKTDVFHITKEGDLLKLSREVFIANLYPIAGNRFFAYIEGSSSEFEFVKDESNRVTKMNVYDEGELFLDAKKIN
jgi:hypothetical protein